jgi:hypothetical protein
LRKIALRSVGESGFPPSCGVEVSELTRGDNCGWVTTLKAEAVKEAGKYPYGPPWTLAKDSLGLFGIGVVGTLALFPGLVRE